jgi:hypothetical protein
MDNVCRIDGCGRARKTAEGLCPTHEHRRRKGLPLDAPVKVYGAPKGPCSVEGCDRKEKSSGMCDTHYRRMKRGLDLLAPIRSPSPRGTNARCEVDHCAKTAVSYGLCSTHAYQRDTGAEIGPRRMIRNVTLAERMEFYTDPPNENGCRLWTGGVNRNGYPSVSLAPGRPGAGHRIAYELATGDKPEPHEPIHHICGVKRCVEPAHLQKITSIENTAEMLERKFYLRRIAELEAEVARLRALTPHGVG